MNQQPNFGISVEDKDLIKRYNPSMPNQPALNSIVDTDMLNIVNNIILDRLSVEDSYVDPMLPSKPMIVTLTYNLYIAYLRSIDMRIGNSEFTFSETIRTIMHNQVITITYGVVTDEDIQLEVFSRLN